MKKWIKIGIGVMAGVIVVLGAVMAGPMMLTQYRVSQADLAVEAGRLDHAVELLLPELERKPKDLALRLKIIDLYLQQENYARAENLLVYGMREQGGLTQLYAMLCDVYVKQDKLWDAVSLLNTLPNPTVKAELQARRPAPPVLSPVPGDYREMLSLTAAVGDGERCYLTLTGKVPTMQTDLYAEPQLLPQGKSEVLAVSVSEDGLVSDWVSGVYSLDDVMEIATFTEPALEARARVLLGQPEGLIRSGQLQAITELVIEEAVAYQTLDDLRWFTGLTELRLLGTGTQVDISALAGLSKLTRVTLCGMGLDSTSLEAIGQLTGLSYLDLSDNQIATLGQLTTLINLEYLSLAENNIIDITPLAPMTKLTTLDCHQNGIEDTVPLAGMTKLVKLNLQNNRVRDIQGVSNLKELVSLNLSYNSIASLEALRGLETLVGLSLSNNKELFSISEPVVSTNEAGEEVTTPGVNSLTPVGTLLGLKTLLLDSCGIEDITPLAPLVQLNTLSLNDNSLSSLAGVEGMANLVEISFNNNNVTSLRTLASLGRLKIIHLEYNNLPSLVAIKDMPSLQAVYAFGNKLTERVSFSSGAKVYTGS